MAKFMYDKLDRTSGDFPEYYVSENGEAIRVTLDEDAPGSGIYAEHGKVSDGAFENDDAWGSSVVGGRLLYGTKDFEAPEESAEGWDAPFMEAYVKWLASLGCE